jgi:hypothetical protein
VSSTENMLHVLRMPVPYEKPAPSVTLLQFYTFLGLTVGVVAVFVIGLARWLAWSSS